MSETKQLDVRLNDDGSLDEVCGNGVSVHLEQMDDDCWYLGVYRGDEIVQVWLRSKRPVKAYYEEHTRAALSKAGAADE